jgi:hypothetical protein
MDQGASVREKVSISFLKKRTKKLFRVMPCSGDARCAARLGGQQGLLLLLPGALTYRQQIQSVAAVGNP